MRRLFSSFRVSSFLRGVVEAPAGWVSRVGVWGVGVGLGLLASKIGCPGGSGVGVLPARPCTPREGLLWG